MSSSAASFDPRALGAALALLVAATFCLRPLERSLVASAGPRGEQLAALAGRGGTFAVLGGMRSAVASGFWLQADLAWEKKDVAATTTLIGLTVAADERPLYFWLNGARMIAYDMPEWQAKEAMLAAVWQQVNLTQARRALDFLAQGLRWRGPDAAFYVEMGNIHLRRTGDIAEAARCYRLAAEQPGAPYYAARIHAELLVQLGRRREALAWLRQILPDLPADDPAARRDVVLARIGELERAGTGK
jgi:tetratricopeptide (TPR) repeat protein